MAHQKILSTVLQMAFGTAFLGVAACGSSDDQSADDSRNLSSDPTASSSTSGTGSPSAPPVAATLPSPVTASPNPPNTQQPPSPVATPPSPTSAPLPQATSPQGSAGAEPVPSETPEPSVSSNDGGSGGLIPRGGASNAGEGGDDGLGQDPTAGSGGEEPAMSGGAGGLGVAGNGGAGMAGASMGGMSGLESGEPRTMGYVGCSMSVNVAQGYETLGGERLWPPVQAYNGKVVQNWANSNDSAWQAFEQQADMYGTPDTVWVMICIFNNMVNYDETKQIIANVRERAPDAVITITGQPLYEEGLTCNLAGSGGPELTDEMAQMAADDPSQNVTYGGIFGPMSADERSDECHANSAGQRALGQQAIDKWGD